MGTYCVGKHTLQYYTLILIGAVTRILLWEKYIYRCYQRAFTSLTDELPNEKAAIMCFSCFSISTRVWLCVCALHSSEVVRIAVFHWINYHCTFPFRNNQPFIKHIRWESKSREEKKKRRDQIKSQRQLKIHLTCTEKSNLRRTKNDWNEKEKMEWLNPLMPHHQIRGDDQAE